MRSLKSGCSSSGRMQAKRGADERSERCTKRPRLSSNNLNPEERLHNLERLGLEWIATYNARQASGLSGEDAYRILALVSTIGSPRVFADLATIRYEIGAQELSPRSTLVGAYANLDKVAQRCVFLKRRIAMFVSRDYDSRLQDEKQKRRAKRCETRVLEQLEKEYHPFTRRYIRRIRDEGREPTRFQNRLHIPNAISLLPAKAIASFLDPAFIVSAQEYIFAFGCSERLTV